MPLTCNRAQLGHELDQIPDAAALRQRLVDLVAARQANS